MMGEAMCPVAHRVIANRPETEDVFTLELKSVDGQDQTSFLPGQFNMLYAFGTGESAISISGNPSNRKSVTHTIRRVGLVTAKLAALKVGDLVGVRGPFGRPWPLDRVGGRDLVFIGGGIGLAPLRPAIMQAVSNRESYNRITILTGARDPTGILYNDELLHWNSLPTVDSRLTVDHADSHWTGDVGVVTTLVNQAEFDPENAVAFVCGPEVMMRYAVIELRNAGIGDEEIYLSLERNMKCAIGFCGHCQFGSEFICRDGPVFRYDHVAFWLDQREI